MQQSTQDHTLLKDIRPMMRKLDIEVIVLQQESETVVTRDGKYIYWYLVADKSGVMVLKAWGPSGGMIKCGDILHVSGVENKFNFGRRILEISRLGKIQRLGQDTFPFVEGPNFSQPSESTQGRLPTTTATTIIPQQPYTNPITQQQQFHQPSLSIRPSPPPPPANYITSSSATSSQFDNINNASAINFGPGWTGGLGRDRDGDERQRALPAPPPDMEQQGTHHHYNKKRPMDATSSNNNNINKEITRMTRRKVDYNELV